MARITIEDSLRVANSVWIGFLASNVPISY